MTACGDEIYSKLRLDARLEENKSLRNLEEPGKKDELICMGSFSMTEHNVNNPKLFDREEAHADLKLHHASKVRPCSLVRAGLPMG